MGPIKSASYINLAKKRKLQPMIKAQVAEKTTEIEAVGSKLEDVLEIEAQNDLRKPYKRLQKMSNEKLVELLTTDDYKEIDELLNHSPTVKSLNRERAELRRQVSDLANFNYAREPEFVRDRKKLRETLDEVGSLRQKVTNAFKQLQPMLDKLNQVQNQLSTKARGLEEESESLAKRFLNQAEEGETQLNYEEFVERYVNIRKGTSMTRILADKLANDRDMLAANVLSRPLEQNSPVPTPRQRKRVSFNK